MPEELSLLERHDRFTERLNMLLARSPPVRVEELRADICLGVGMLAGAGYVGAAAALAYMADCFSGGEAGWPWSSEIDDGGEQ